MIDCREFKAGIETLRLILKNWYWDSEKLPLPFDTYLKCTYINTFVKVGEVVLLPREMNKLESH